MKKIFAIALALALVCGLCACGRKNANSQATPTTAPTTATTTEPVITTTQPIMDPTIDTNIPDPEVDTSMPGMTDLLPTDDSTSESTSAGTTGTEKVQ